MGPDREGGLAALDLTCRQRSRFTKIVRSSEASTENRIIPRQPAPPPSGRTSTFRPKPHASSVYGSRTPSFAKPRLTM